MPKCVWVAAVAAIVSFGAAVARAQDGVSLDADEPCAGSVGLPAISRDGRTVAVVWCWSDLSAARETQLRFYDVGTGRLRRGMVLDHAHTGGVRQMPPERRRRAVARAQTVLRRGRFSALAPADLETTRAAWASRLGGYTSHPYCCGIDDPAVRSCTLPAEIRAAWTLPQGALLLELITTMGPDGCEHGPDHRLVR